MPIHFNDLDVVSQADGLSTALIAPCYMCPAATLSVRENKPFMQLYRSFLTSSPFEEYMKQLQSRLKDKGVNSDVFRSKFYHQWFMCMWTSGRRRKLTEYAKRYNAVIVLGCESATETVRDAVAATDCKVIEGMKVTGIMNAKMSFHLPADISFEDCRIVPISRHENKEDSG